MSAMPVFATRVRWLRGYDIPVQHYMVQTYPTSRAKPKGGQSLPILYQDGRSSLVGFNGLLFLDASGYAVQPL